MKESFSDDGSLDVRKHMNALKIALAVLCFAAAEDLKGQACQGCTCSGSKGVHPATTLEDCVQGCLHSRARMRRKRHHPDGNRNRPWIWGTTQNQMGGY
jgi:hypothetical protein